MSLLSARFPSWFRVAGAVVAVISLIALPEDTGTWWERLQDIGGMLQDNPLAGGALAVGVVLLILGNLQWIQRTIGMKRWASDKALETELRDWLTEAGFSLEVPVMTTELSKQASFVFAAKTANRPVAVVRPLNVPGIRLQCIVKPDAAHAEVIRGMDADEESSFKEDLGIELARLAIGFSLEDILGAGIVIDYPILVTDTLTKWQFVDRVNFVVRAILLVQLVVTRHVRAAQRKAKADLTPVPLSTPDTATPPPQEPPQ